jgi:hypothetical protein
MVCIDSNDFDGEPKDFNDSNMGFQRNLMVLMGIARFIEDTINFVTNFVPQGLFIH